MKMITRDWLNKQLKIVDIRDQRSAERYLKLYGEPLCCLRVGEPCHATLFSNSEWRKPSPRKALNLTLDLVNWKPTIKTIEITRYDNRV